MGDRFLGAEDAGAMIQRRTPKSSCQQKLIDMVGVSLVYGCDRLVNLEENGPNGWEVQNHGECVLRTDKRYLQPTTISPPRPPTSSAFCRCRLQSC